MLIEVYESLGREIRRTLSGFHSFTRCDQISGNLRKFKEADREIIQTFQILGEQLTDKVKEGLEVFVMTMYCNNIPSSVKDISSLQWYLFSKHQFESEKLPPTQITLV